MARYIGVLLLVSLALWTGEAGGACAWVVWQSVGTYEESKAVPVLAMPTREDCVRVQAERAMELYQEGKRFKVFCLPDTIDPRAPKGTE